MLRWIKGPKFSRDDGKPEVAHIVVFSSPNHHQLAEMKFDPPVRGIQVAIGMALAAARKAEDEAEARGEVLQPKVPEDGQGYWPIRLEAE